MLHHKGSYNNAKKVSLTHLSFSIKGTVTSIMHIILILLKRIQTKIRRSLSRGANFALGFIAGPFVSAIAPIVRFMAYTGAGTSACLRRMCLPIPVNFYSPVPDVEDLERRKVWEYRSDLVGIDFRPKAQLALLKELGHKFGHECDWPPQSSGEPDQFYTENGTFSYGCAASTHCILRDFKPRQVVEIGSGNSSLVIGSALIMNANNDPGRSAKYSIIDPYPSKIINKSLPGLTQLITQRVEVLDVNFFEQLGENDVLFIDSGHTVRIGGDVNFLILDVLPRLAPGVIVHFHDIGLPYEYPKVYATNPQFRVFWTEAYLLQAFLCFNSQFEVLLAMSYLMTEHIKEFRVAFSPYNPATHVASSGSFWLRRT